MRSGNTGTIFGRNSDMFGGAASAPAQWAAVRLQHEGKSQLLELGAGQGRDTLFFAANGFAVSVLDYSASGVAAITMPRLSKMGWRHGLT
ncbi:hypothetical protein [Shewanella sp.]|uniref:hypothetical protein n=1 Tax=Shewanella sp. TaxID=50422 RepID=UPI003D0DC95F